MLTLRLTQFTEAEDKYRVEVALEGDRLPRQTATSRFEFKLTPQDHEDLRWYLEDYLQYPLDPAPKIAARIEKRMSEIGVELFKAVFQANDDARDLWATLRDKLDDTRVEIIAGVTEATGIPWELLRDPKTDAALALRAQAFVRSQPQAAQPQRPQLPEKKFRPHSHSARHLPPGRSRRCALPLGCPFSHQRLEHRRGASLSTGRAAAADF
jgi:hypothetical protein